MLKEITLMEAFEKLNRGELVLCLAPGLKGDGEWERYETTYLQDLLEDVRYLDDVDKTQAEPPKSPEKPLKERAGMSGTGKSKIELDKGKLRALWKAGWSAEKIADEMNISTSTVYYHTKKFAYEEARKAEKEAEENNHD